MACYRGGHGAMDPLAFPDDDEVTLPDVVWGWNDLNLTSRPPTTSAPSNSTGPQAASLLESLTPSAATASISHGRQLPAVAHMLYEEKGGHNHGRQDPPPGKVSPSGGGRRKKRSVVASFFHGLKGTITGGEPHHLPPTEAASHDPPDDLGQDEAPPILATLESISYSRSADGSPQRTPSPSKQKALVPLPDRDLAAFRFTDGPEASSSTHPLPPELPSPPKQLGAVDGDLRPRIRFHSVSGSGLSPPKEIRGLPSSEKPSSAMRQRRSTKTSIQRGAHRLAVDDNLAQSGILSTAADHRVDDEFLDFVGGCSLDADCVQATQSGSTHIDCNLALGVKSPRSLPPIASHSCAAEPPSPSSPAKQLKRKPAPRQQQQVTGGAAPGQVGTSTALDSLSLSSDTLDTDDVAAERLPICAACGKHVSPTNVALALDATHVVHRACFCCSSCHEPLTLANFHLIAPTGIPNSAAGQSRLVCTTDYVELLESMQHAR